MFTTKKGFTLIELLVVIAILAVLATAVVVILNPAQLVKQGRDSTRISDLAALHSAIALYLSDVDSPTWVASSNCSCGSTVETTTSPHGLTACSKSTSTLVDGTGWVPVDLTDISSGSPLARLPLDPVNNGTYYYGYKQTASLTFELDSNMESTKYSTNGSGDVESDAYDGGNDGDWYEIGNDPGLDL